MNNPRQSVPYLPAVLETKEAGMTLIEIIVVLGVLAILFGIAAPNLRTPPARVAANSVTAFLQQAKFEAIKRNRPILVIGSDDGSRLQAYAATAASDMGCAAGTSSLVREIGVDEYRGVQLEGDGLPFLWLPTGQPRACGGAPISASGVSILLIGDRDQAAVAVGPQGAVTTQ